MEKMDRKNNKHKNLGLLQPMLPKLGLRYPNLRRNNKMMIIDVIIYNLYAEIIKIQLEIKQELELELE